MTAVAAPVRYPSSRFETQAWVDLRDPAEQARLTPAALRGMGQLSAAWGLTVPQTCSLLGDVSPSSWHAWVRTPPKSLGVDRLTRASYLLGIYTALHVLYGDDLADEWVHLPNTNALFAGATPLDVMLRGGIPAMERVRALLDARRGGS
jgi:hypothetical protein